MAMGPLMCLKLSSHRATKELASAIWYIKLRLSGIKYQSNVAPTTHLDALVNVDDGTDGVADDEDDDDGEEHHGNLQQCIMISGSP